MEDKVSNTISIIGIPKTATMEQVIIKQKSNFKCLLLWLPAYVGISWHGQPRHNSLFLIFSFADSWCLCSP